MSDTDTVKRAWGYVAEFSDAAALYEAAKKVREEGYRRWDVHSPFPIHGMDAAMGLGPSWLPKIVFCGGVMGTMTALFLQFTTQAGLLKGLGYPTIVQSKPANLFTIPAFFPITFELTILFSAFTILFGLFIILKLPRLHHPLFASKTFTRFSDDGFILSVEARDPRFSRKETLAMLESIGASKVELVEEEL